MTPAEELLIHFPAAIGNGKLYVKNYGLLLERPIETHENIIQVTRLVQEAADWIGYEVAGYVSRLRGGNPYEDITLKPKKNGTAVGWLAIERKDMEWMRDLAMEIGEMQNYLSDDGPDNQAEEKLRIACEQLGDMMADYLMTWRS